MGVTAYTLQSGVDRGSGLVDTQDEGYINQYSIFEGGEWLTIQTVIREDGDTPPPVGNSPDFGHSAVGYVDDNGDGKLKVEWRGFWRFDFHGIDRANVISARLYWDRRSADVFAGYSNDIKKARFEWGWDIVGGKLRSADWGKTYDGVLFDRVWPQWADEDGLFSTGIPDLSIFRDNPGASVRFDVRVMLFGYVPADTGIRVDLSAGDNSKTDAPFLEIVVDADVRRILSELSGAEREAKIREIDAAAAVYADAERKVRLSGNMPADSVVSEPTRRAILAANGVPSAMISGPMRTSSLAEISSRMAALFGTSRAASMREDGAVTAEIAEAERTARLIERTVE